MNTQETLESVLRLRVGAHDAHYGGGLVDGARMLQLFGDAATELCILHDGDEGLFRAYDSVEFLAPVYACDYIQVRAQLVKVGRMFAPDDFYGAQGDPGSLQRCLRFGR